LAQASGPVCQVIDQVLYFWIRMAFRVFRVFRGLIVCISCTSWFDPGLRVLPEGLFRCEIPFLLLYFAFAGKMVCRRGKPWMALPDPYRRVQRQGIEDESPPHEQFGLSGNPTRPA
jgi:hypothetical protein